MLDLGISADTEIKNLAQNVLFTVNPLDENIALENIREALNIYLQLPNLPDLNQYTSSNKDISVKQLESIIYYLKSQLAMSEAIIQTKNATIETLELSNYQYKYLINNSPQKQLSEEPIFGNIIKLKEFEGNGFSIDFAEIFRKLKRKISIK